MKAPLAHLVYIGAMLSAGAGLAQQPPGAVVEGAPSVTIGGKPAARQADQTTTGAPISGGASNVFINGRPAATVGSKTECGGVIVSGSPSVFINGRQAATATSLATPCPGQ